MEPLRSNGPMDDGPLVTWGSLKNGWLDRNFTAILLNSADALHL